ncbi:MAG: hypothetical protein ACOXZ5_10155 [Syntrophomonadaceae bacterium]
MTELQQTFLFYTAIYFVIKGGLYVALYVATLVVEREARLRHKRLKLYLNKKRSLEQERWKVAYQLYEKQNQFNPSEFSRAS